MSLYQRCSYIAFYLKNLDIFSRAFIFQFVTNIILTHIFGKSVTIYRTFMEKIGMDNDKWIEDCSQPVDNGPLILPMLGFDYILPSTNGIFPGALGKVVNIGIGDDTLVQPVFHRMGLCAGGNTAFGFCEVRSQRDKHLIFEFNRSLLNFCVSKPFTPIAAFVRNQRPM